MKCFPQLASGCIVQRPLECTLAFRSPRTETAGGKAWRLLRDESSWILWDLQYEQLSEAEKDAIEATFLWAGGGMREFAFHDPLANLLSDSEDLSAASWSRSASIVLSPASQDPGRGRGWTVRNDSAQTAELWQTIPCEPGFRFCLSAEVRMNSTGWAQVFSGEHASLELTSGDWKRVSATGEANGEFQRSGIRLGSGTIVEVREPQLEPQAAPSEYKESSGRPSIHAATRFADDQLEWTATGPGLYSATIRLISAVSR